MNVNNQKRFAWEINLVYQEVFRKVYRKDGLYWAYNDNERRASPPRVGGQSSGYKYR